MKSAAMNWMIPPWRPLYRGLALLLSLGLATAALAADLMPAKLDITQPCEGLPAVTPGSPPDVVVRAIQGRIDYLTSHNMRGRVYLPAGEWRIDKPVFMTGDCRELVGAGIGRTILRAADGYRAMPMINVAVRSYQAERPLQTANRPPLLGVYDASVTESRFGLRTYTEYPPDSFPQTSHLGVPAPAKVPDWATGTTYKVNDVVLLHPQMSQRGIDAICVTAHTASPTNQPYAGADWKKYWVLRLPYNVQFVADPLAAGAYNPATKRASNWEGMTSFTLDFGFVVNIDPQIYGEQWRPLVGVYTENAYITDRRVWTLARPSNGNLEFSLTLANGFARSLNLGPLRTVGAYRVAVQVDFAQHRVQAWVQAPGETAARRVVDDATLPAGVGFRRLEYGFGGIVAGESGNPPQDNGNHEPPTDITVIGYHTAHALRYADTATLAPRTGNGTADDQYRFFANDAGTLAYLPLTDNPAVPDLATLGRLVTVQHGEAAGDAAQKGYGYLHVPTTTYAVTAPRVSDLTIVPGPVWGMGLVNWNVIDSKFWNLDLRGGYYAVGDLFMGAQYTIDVRHSTLSGSEAAYNGSMNIIYLRDVTIGPVGRCGLLLSGSNCVLDDVRFRDPQTFQSEYYLRHIFTTIYGGMNSLNHVAALAPADSRYPSRAAFSMQSFGSYRTSMMLDDCRVANLGPDAAFLNLDFYGTEGHGSIAVEDCTYRGSQIAAFVRTDSPWWSGPVIGYAADTPVRRKLELLTPPFAPWAPGRDYPAGAFVVQGPQAYKCLKAHKADPASQPGAPTAAALWQPVASNFY